MDNSELPLSQLNHKKEVVFKKRRDQHKLKEAAAKKAEAKKKQKQKPRTHFKRLDQILKDRKAFEGEKRRLNRLENSQVQLPDFKDAKCLFVIRSRKINKIPEQVQKVLKEFRLTSLNFGVFIKPTEDNIKKIKLISPYVFYGEPSLKSIKNLVLKRGFTKKDGKVVPLDNNTIIEETLGDLGFICLDDLIHELSTNGENFDKISGFLVPFRFSKLADKKSKKGVVSSTVMEKQTPKAKSEFINRILMRLN